MTTTAETSSAGTGTESGSGATEVPRGHRIRRTRVLLAVAGGWLLFTLLDRLLTHSLTLWALTDMMPPELLLAVPLTVLAATWWARPGVRRWIAAAAVVALLLGFGRSGINPYALWNGSDTTPSAGAVKIVSWNTEYWEQGDDPAAFYAYIRSLDADVYLLQEYIHQGKGTELIPLHLEDRLKKEFPGYRVLVQGELVTLSRFDVVGTPHEVAPQVMRVDVRTGRSADAPVLSTYNVHLPVHVYLDNPFKPSVLSGVRRQTGVRNGELDDLIADVRARKHQPAFIAGDFNHSRTQDDTGRLGKVATDAVRVNHDLFPRSWRASTPVMDLWRLDLAFTAGGAKADRYDFAGPRGHSDHSAQSLTIEPGH
ncbi:endonuclease/exonuclease/phosphatase family protein [Streptomyces sp. NBC_00388]|uniref:endonuclease/exonuclease/phosphatase family protein n=1 Tax=Streptomyces sp. NBC_00388 TaxID=2975735 RepID=UPI002E221AAC